MALWSPATVLTMKFEVMESNRKYCQRQYNSTTLSRVDEIYCNFPLKPNVRIYGIRLDLPIENGKWDGL